VAFMQRTRDDLAPWLREFRHTGSSGVPGAALWRSGSIVLNIVIAMTNVIGGVIAVVLALFVVPLPHAADVAHVRILNVIVAACYIVAAVPVGAIVGTRGMYKLRDWLREDRPATPAEQRIVLRAPLRLFVVQFTLWLGAAVLFGIINTAYEGLTGYGVALLVSLTGVVTASCSYLFCERIMRGTAARALAHDLPERLAVPGVATRSVLAWGIGTGVPIFGLLTIGIAQLGGSLHAHSSGLSVAIVVLGSIGLGIGLLSVSLAARATADPIDSVRRALAEVEHGRFDQQIPVYDGTQIGQLQQGFNQMTLGLAERERIRAAFGVYVDPDVAEFILDEGTRMAGEEVEVTMMFVDVRNFTGFAERTPARDVVAGINQLFERIVPIVRDHGGHVDKFIGDGMLAVFGAPRRQSDHADQALAAALEIARAVRAGETGTLEVGIGLNTGVVVAGNVGGGGRFEFSVIGDAVNVAARVERATRQTGDIVLVAERTKELLHDSPVAFTPRLGLTLRGKTEPVSLFAPALS
jgi:adenylate cyclase